tara:strand:- start:533 stop:817 length:285 start_codon:yes stop_codon:yes gene_type:complete
MKLQEENPLVQRTLNNGSDIVELVFIKAERALKKHGMDLMFFGHGDACFDNMQEEWFKDIPFNSHELHMIELAHGFTDLNYTVEAKNAGRIEQY